METPVYSHHSHNHMELDPPFWGISLQFHFLMFSDLTRKMLILLLREVS